MKIERKNRRPTLLITGAIAALLLASGAYAIFASGIFSPTSSDTGKVTDKINYDEPTDAQKQSGDDAKKNTIEKDQASKDDDDTGGSTGLTVNLTTSTVSEGVLYVHSEIDGIYASGTCILTLTSTDKTVTKESGIQALPQSSTCKGFNIPTSELAPGTWSIHLKVTVDSKTGEATGKVTI